MVTVTIEDEPQLCCLCLCDYRPNPYLDAVNPTLKATAAKVGRASLRLKPLLMLPSAVHGRNLLHLCCVVASSCSGLTSPERCLVQHRYSVGSDIPMSACVCLLQMNNPLHLWKLWDPEVRYQRRCFAGNDAIMAQKIQRLRKNPPAAHTIAGERSRQSSVRSLDAAWRAVANCCQRKAL